MPQHRGQCGHLFASWDNHKLCASCRTCSQEDVCSICRHWGEDQWKRHNNRRIYKAKRHKSNTGGTAPPPPPPDWVNNKPFHTFTSNYNPQCHFPPQTTDAMNFPLAYPNQNSRPPEPLNSINMSRHHLMPSLKLLDNTFDPNKQISGPHGLLSPVWVKQERSEENQIHQPPTPVSYPADDRSITMTPVSSCLSVSSDVGNPVPPPPPPLPPPPPSTAPPTAPAPPPPPPPPPPGLPQFSPTINSSCESPQKDLGAANRNTNVSCLSNNNVKMQNGYSVPLDFPTLGDEDRHITISRKCLRTLMSLVSCPVCQAPVNHQETIQGFKAGTLFCLNLFCYNGHNIQPRW